MTAEVQVSHFAKYRFFNSQSTDFSIRKVQIFQFVLFRFAKNNKPAHSGFAKLNLELIYFLIKIPRLWKAHKVTAIMFGSLVELFEWQTQNP